MMISRPSMSRLREMVCLTGGRHAQPRRCRNSRIGARFRILGRLFVNTMGCVSPPCPSVWEIAT
ncbi:hypothetical protein AOQ84DRAFT_198153 [Glonium stellatum]|uniref:Uncharacterized protein n=1 Tax=Glonium stellatum TaxID=574774 RepID=A0A8E2JVG1_9PEZI|nr:hypothetical protein AOQ84DRAFT_198153 [Glonium stellatum]